MCEGNSFQSLGMKPEKAPSSMREERGNRDCCNTVMEDER